MIGFTPPSRLAIPPPTYLFYTLNSENALNDGGRYLSNGCRTFEFEEEARNEVPLLFMLKHRCVSITTSFTCPMPNTSL